MNEADASMLQKLYQLWLKSVNVSSIIQRNQSQQPPAVTPVSHLKANILSVSSEAAPPEPLQIPSGHEQSVVPAPFNTRISNTDERGLPFLPLPIPNCLAVARNSVVNRPQTTDATNAFIAQLEILLKAPEGTRAHAIECLALLTTSEYALRKMSALECKVDV